MERAFIFSPIIQYLCFHLIFHYFEQILMINFYFHLFLETNFLQLTVDSLHSYQILFQISSYNHFLTPNMESQDYDQLVYLEVLNTFDKLRLHISEITDPSLNQYLQIWKIDKGAKKLIELAIEGDRLLTRESKNFKKSFKIQSQSMASAEQKVNSQQKINKKDVFLQKKKSAPVKREIEECNENQCDNFQRQKSQKSVQIKKQEEQQIEDDLQDVIDSRGFFSLSEVQVFDPFIKKQEIRAQKKYMRGPYKNYSREMKKKMVELYKQGEIPISKLSSQYGVPIKNIKRWADYGIDRKEGAGRKRLDPNMEDELYSKIRQLYPLTSSIDMESIKSLALNLSNKHDFKASKGWVMSFIDRHRLQDKYLII